MHIWSLMKSSKLNAIAFTFACWAVTFVLMLTIGTITPTSKIEAILVYSTLFVNGLILGTSALFLGVKLASAYAKKVQKEIWLHLFLSIVRINLISTFPCIWMLKHFWGEFDYVTFVIAFWFPALLMVSLETVRNMQLKRVRVRKN